MDTLKTYPENIADIVSNNIPEIGDKFIVFRGEKNTFGKILEIIECRKEKGILIDESKRRSWAKVKYELI
jgi:hypothetical protein